MSDRDAVRRALMLAIEWESSLIGCLGRRYSDQCGQINECQQNIMARQIRMNDALRERLNKKIDRDIRFVELEAVVNMAYRDAEPLVRLGTISTFTWLRALSPMPPRVRKTLDKVI